ncbi:zinc finger MYM-type protein 1-like [Hydra vulgaris]|uniref:zinc finger MYM-type protein 1-like n=1 Tax=Hydra vulgaris TaxID=6087 RepID=UPI0032EA81A8
MKTLSKIILESNKKAEIAQATGLRKKMDCLDFLCILVLIIEILAPLNIVSTFKQSQIKRTKKLFDDGGVNFRFETAEHQFKVDVFNTVIDIVTNQIDSRFTSLKTVNSYFSFLNPKNIILLDSDKIFTRATNLQNKYPIDISDSFPNQMVLFKKMEIKDVDSILDLLKLITITYCDVSCSFTEIIGALTLYLTLPVSVATAERSFSTLKRIKTHLRTTMAQNRLSALSLLAIEAEEAAKLDLKDVINQFAAMKARKKQFR